MYLLLAQNQEIRLQRNSTFDTMKKKNVLTSNNDDLYPPTMPATIVDPKRKKGNDPLNIFKKKSYVNALEERKDVIYPHKSVFTHSFWRIVTRFLETFFQFSPEKGRIFSVKKRIEKTTWVFPKIGLPQKWMEFIREKP